MWKIYPSLSWWIWGGSFGRSIWNEGYYNRSKQSDYWRMRFLLVYSTTHALKWLFTCPCYVYFHVLVMSISRSLLCWNPYALMWATTTLVTWRRLLSHKHIWVMSVLHQPDRLAQHGTKVMLALSMPLTHLKAKGICIKLLVDSLTYIIMHLHIIMIGFTLAWFCPSGDWKRYTIYIFENLNVDIHNLEVLNQADEWRRHKKKNGVK